MAKPLIGSRFSLRTMLLVIALLAFIFGAVIGYRRATMAQLRWIEPESAQAQSFVPLAVIERTDHQEYQFTYYAKHRSIQKLLSSLQGVSFIVHEEMVTVTAPDRALAEASLKSLQDADVLPKGAVVIRGRVRDRKGRAVGEAQVDVMGWFVFINCFKTRPDGTFTMALTDENATVPMQGGYYIVVRDPEETADNRLRWNTTYFTLDADEPERVAEIAIPK